jgi:multidrug resistance efflux pump
MATAFSRSLRSIEADRGHRAVWGVLLAAAFLVAWLAWFALARITLLEVTDTAWLEAEAPGIGTPALKGVALFAPDALGHIRPGQPAQLHLRVSPRPRYGGLPATVDRVLGLDESGQVRVELVLHPEPGTAHPLQAGQPATVEIEVERLSPAALMLRAAGRWSGP